HAGWVLVMKLNQEYTDVVPGSKWSFVEGEFGGTMGYLGLAWLGLLGAAWYALEYRRAPRLRRGARAGTRLAFPAGRSRRSEASPIAATPHSSRPDRAGPVIVRAVSVDAPLRYVNGDEPGLTRRRCGRGFKYLDDTGEPVRDRAVRRRLAALAGPPAWSAVWRWTH